MDFIICVICNENTNTEYTNKCNNKKCKKVFCDLCINKCLSFKSPKCPSCKYRIRTYHHFNCVRMNILYAWGESCYLFSRFINKRYDIDYDKLLTITADTIYNNDIYYGITDYYKHEERLLDRRQSIMFYLKEDEKNPSKYIMSKHI